MAFTSPSSRRCLAFLAGAVMIVPVARGLAQTPTAAPRANATVQQKGRAAAASSGDWLQVRRLADSVEAIAGGLNASVPIQGGTSNAGTSGVVPVPVRALNALADVFALSTTADPQLDPAIVALLTLQASPGRSDDPERFRVVRALVETLTKASPTAHLDELLGIYENSHRAVSEVQLQENEQLGRLIHSALAHVGLTESPDYRRSASYKRLLRRRLQLAAHPVAPLP